MPSVPVITVYTASGCCLCDDAKAQLAELESELGFVTDWIFIDDDPELEAKYREQIPVGFIEQRKIFKYHVDVGLLRRRLAELDNRAARAQMNGD